MTNEKEENRTLDSVNFILFADYLGYKSKLFSIARELFFDEYRYFNISSILDRILYLESTVLLHEMLQDITMEELQMYLDIYYDMMTNAQDYSDLPF